MDQNKMQKVIAITIVIIGIIGLASANQLVIASLTGRNIEVGNECLFDPSLPKCARGPEGCPKGFVTNAYEECLPRHPGGCPEGYHSHEDDESGKCISDSEDCAKGYVMNPDYAECRRLEFVCAKYPLIDDCMFNNTTAVYDLVD
jgi:hypothetical protein